MGAREEAQESKTFLVLKEYMSDWMGLELSATLLFH